MGERAREKKQGEQRISFSFFLFFLSKDAEEHSRRNEFLPQYPAKKKVLKSARVNLIYERVWLFNWLSRTSSHPDSLFQYLLCCAYDDVAKFRLFQTTAYEYVLWK